MEVMVMKESILGQIAALKEMSTERLQKKYEEVFNGNKPVSNNRGYLWKKIAYRIQEIQYGGISKEAQGKIRQLMEEYDPINNKAIRPEKPSGEKPQLKSGTRDRRLPIPGTVITKEYKNNTIQVKVLEKGFEYSGKTYRSLTAIAKEVTGAHWNGYLFFNL